MFVIIAFRYSELPFGEKSTYWSKQLQEMSLLLCVCEKHKSTEFTKMVGTNWRLGLWGLLKIGIGKWYEYWRHGREASAKYTTEPNGPGTNLHIDMVCVPKRGT